MTVHRLAADILDATDNFLERIIYCSFAPHKCTNLRLQVFISVCRKVNNTFF